MTKLIRNFCIGGVFAALASFSGLAVAAPVTFNFTAQITQVHVSLLADVSVGDTLSGSMTYELLTPDSVASPSIGGYSGAISSLSYAGGAISGNGSGSIGIGNNQPLGDLFTGVGASSFSGVSASGNMDFRMELRDSDATALSDDSLPTSAGFFGGGNFAGISDGAMIQLFLSDGAFSGVSAEALIDPSAAFGLLTGVEALILTLTTDTETGQVSEPAILLLFGFGVAGIALVNRRARRRIT